MNSLEFEVLRSDPGAGQAPVWQRFSVPADGEFTVLGALQYVQDHQDHTLAFRFACRNKICGLCAMEVNGIPCLACKVKLRGGMRLAPLSRLPVIRDLVVDRAMLLSRLQSAGIFFDGDTESDLPVFESEKGARLRACTECMACLSACPKYGGENGAFAGPFFLVKLAQLDEDPRDTGDRKLQARQLGIEACRGCMGGCRCLGGIDIYHAIQNLLANSPE